MGDYLSRRATALSYRLIAAAVLFVPPIERLRWREQWDADLDDIRREGLPVLMPALRMLIGAPAVGRSLRRANNQIALAERLNGSIPYDVYLSHASGDSRVAANLGHQMIKLVPPRSRPRRMTVFRANSDLVADFGLADEVVRALDRSNWLVLLASPRSAQSAWVSREIECWLQKKGPGRILLALTEGEIRWDAETSDFDWTVTNSLPESMSGVFDREPLWVDLRRVGEYPDVIYPGYRNKLTSLCAPIHGVPRSELAFEQFHLHFVTVKTRAQHARSIVLMLLAWVLTYAMLIVLVSPLV
ncbi:hypothetical protein [Nocardia sp. NPDC052566]|uniref:hypothetical protein n=1 Tax=Nocardia sp. NPDC052566 TaxID=3364330 RepID=UPI0037C5BF3D